MNEIKIRFKKPVYSIDKERGIISCVLHYKVTCPNFIQNIFSLNHCTTGVAQLKEGDVWDENIGKKISLAKAEQKAYAKVQKKCVETFRKCYKTLLLCDWFYEKSEYVINHNSNYISKF